MRTLSLDLRGRSGNDSILQENSARGAAASVLVHGVGLSALILLPLLSATESPDATKAFKKILLMPTVAVPELPPPPSVRSRPASSGGSARQAPSVVLQISPPTGIPTTMPIGDVLDAPTTVAVGPGPIGEPGGSGIGGDCAVGAMCGSAVPQIETPKEPTRIGGHIKEPQLLEIRQPVYPDLARAAGLSATVIMEVHVDSNGRVADVNVLRGHPLFDDAALASARSRRYQPLLLNGVRTDFIVTITVVFNLRR